jgi:hypothetical protein
MAIEPRMGIGADQPDPGAGLIHGANPLGECRQIVEAFHIRRTEPAALALAPVEDKLDRLLQLDEQPHGLGQMRDIRGLLALERQVLTRQRLAVHRTSRISLVDYVGNSPG